MIAGLSRGRDRSSFALTSPDEDPAGEMHLTYRIYDIESIARYTERLLVPLLQELEGLGQGCLRARLQLTLDNGRREALLLATDRPTAYPTRFLRQLRRGLSQTTLRAGVVSLKIMIPEVTVLPAEQLVFTGGGSPGGKRERGRAEDKLSRDNRFRTVALRPAFLPERSYKLLPFRIRKSQKSEKAAAPAVFDTLGSVGGLRLLKVPRAVEIATRNGRPQAIGRSHRAGIRASLGPWRVSGGWWQESFDRLYYRFETEGNGRYLCFFDRLRKAWYLQGVFD